MTPPVAQVSRPPLPPPLPLSLAQSTALLSHPPPSPTTHNLPSRRHSLPDLTKLKEEWYCKEALQVNTLPPGKLQIDLLNFQSDVKVKRPQMRLRMGSQHYYSSRSKDATGNWNEGFIFTISYHNQLFDTIELDLYDKRKGWHNKTRHVGKAKLKISSIKGRDDVFLTFLPMYEYHVRRYLPAHIQLPHNFLKSHMPTVPNFSSIQRSLQSRISDQKNVTSQDADDDDTETLVIPDLQYHQHPSHRKHSMTPLIGSIQIRVRYIYQIPPDGLTEDLKPIYMPYNGTKEFDTCSLASSQHNPSSYSVHSRYSGKSLYSTGSSNVSNSTICSDGLQSSLADFHDAVEPKLVYVDDLKRVSPTAADRQNPPLRRDSSIDLIFEQKLHHEMARPTDPSSAKRSASYAREQFGFSQCDVDSRNKNTRKTNSGTSTPDNASIRSHNFGDKNFAFRWINETFDEVALSHPSLDRMIGLVVSPQTRTLLRAVVKMFNAFGQGFKITGMQLLSSLSLLQTFYSDIPRPPPAERVSDLRFLDEGYYFLGHAIIAYGWRGISYLGDYAKYLKDVMKTRSNKEAIVRFLKIPPEDLLGYEYGLRKGAVFQPSYFVSLDRGHEAVVLGIRGTWSLYDCITDLVCEYRPWKGGLVHSGLLASAQWFFTRIIPQIFHYIHEQSKSSDRPISSFIITGHSLGAGAAAILTMMIVDHLDELRQLSGNPNFRIHCYSYAPVAAVSLDLAEKHKEYITSFVCHDDLVARLSYGTASCAKELIMDALIAVDGMGGTSKLNADEIAKKACFDIIKKRREEIFHSTEPKYPLLYIPGSVYQFRRSNKPVSTVPSSLRPRSSSASSSKSTPAKPSKLTSSQSEPALFLKDDDQPGEVSFTLHKSSPLISEEVLVSKTCLEDHMLVTYLNAFQMVRRECMLHSNPESSEKKSEQDNLQAPLKSSMEASASNLHATNSQQNHVL
ncbi:uncharacterized protein BYT42DRAFT_560903 [Radiomyces spectabilis]|uniref:uncharacterized protein n=1 Tax=Radiomyces spectabilis TaxID=64574 RepID=UPI00222021D8|nr:uncharacterized protein BYT42DRAFT_560903 [Radiomyces spectabilis]KAI8388688.1 hypothetical protein BYT42DRAFT_560903 [Radiomyces spectabilis]